MFFFLSSCFASALFVGTILLEGDSSEILLLNEHFSLSFSKDISEFVFILVLLGNVSYLRLSASFFE